MNFKYIEIMRKMKNKELCIRLMGLLLGLLPAIGAMAAQVDVQTARSQAVQFLASRQAGKLMSHAPSLQLAHAERSMASLAACDYYVFNTSDGSAFVIVSGDDRAATVLGYGDGALDMSNLPCNLQWWLGQYKEQMEYLYAHPGLQVEAAPSITADDENTVMPILTCNWSQSEPYYNYCPVVNGMHCVTGCVATAMAQVMYHWRYPASCGPLAAYTTVGGVGKSSIDVEALPGTAFDWDNMVDSYLGNYTTEQADAVATLMRYCGQSVWMGYGVNGSGAYVDSQMSGMRFMGYSSSITHVHRRSYSRTYWISLIETEMKANRPILYSGDDPSGGHAFVLDGMRDGMFHINWGWAGTGNGFFAMDAFNVRGYEFNNGQEMLIRIIPGTIHPVTTGYDFEKNGIYYKVEGDEAVVTYCNTTYNSYSGSVIVPSLVAENGIQYPVTSIGPRAFRNCLNLTHVTLPDGIETIGEQAFANCLNLERIDLPKHLKTIGEYAFEECRALRTVSIPASLQRVEAKAFHQCEALSEVLVEDLAPWYDIYFEEFTSNPLYFAHHLVVDGTPVEHLEVPGTIAEIGRFAFAGLSELKTLVLDEGVKTVGGGAFAYCDGLSSVVMSETTTQLGNSAFFGCSNLEQLNLSDSLTYIGATAFGACSSLKHFTMPQSLVTIGEKAFANCTALSSVQFNPALRSVGVDAFLSCENLVQVDIANLEDWCRISFGSEYANPVRYSHHLYLDGNEVTDIHIPASITHIGDYAFAGASQVASVTMDDQVNGIGTCAFYSCKKLSRVSLSSQLKNIGSRAFSFCSALERVALGDAIKTVADSAFFFCSALKHVTLGSNVKSIGRMPFFMCNKVDTIVCKAVTPPAVNATSSFDNYKSLLIVPDGCENAYKNANIWKRFSNIVSADLDVFVMGDVNGDREVNIADINKMIDTIMTVSVIEAKCDVNGDGEINIADINAIIDLILSGGN